MTLSDNLIILLCIPYLLAETLWDGLRVDVKEMKPSRKPPPRSKARDQPISPDGTNRRLNIHEQEQSPLFRLPYELRCKIYEKIVPKEKLWIFQDGRETNINGNRTWKLPRGREMRVRAVWDTSVPGFSDDSKAIRRQKTLKKELSGKWGLSVVPLLQTCRRVYTELKEPLYGNPTFVFPDCITFFAFSTSILPQRFARIKKVELAFAEFSWPGRYMFDKRLGRYMKYRRIFNVVRDYGSLDLRDLSATFWGDVFETLDKMEGLKELKLCVDYNEWYLSSCLTNMSRLHVAQDVNVQMGIYRDLRDYSEGTGGFVFDILTLFVEKGDGDEEVKERWVDEDGEGVVFDGVELVKHGQMRKEIVGSLPEAEL